MKYLLSRLRERLWLRPLLMSVLSVALALLAKTADWGDFANHLPDIGADTIAALLKVIASSMLVIATFAVGSMVASYASASESATPRSFPLIVADDVSQNALSSFIGAFIFSIVALTAILHGFYEQGGRFAIFILTLFTFAGVIATFVRWVDRIARLGRLGVTIEKAEAATAKALRRRRLEPTLNAASVRSREDRGEPIYGNYVGYVQRIETAELQAHAEQNDLQIEIAALPGAFAMPGRPLAYVTAGKGAAIDQERIAAGFVLDDDRTFDDDPRFGFVVLSEIASRALSPGINDPGTAIDIINAFVRLFDLWAKPLDSQEKKPIRYDRIEVPELSTLDMFEDAFRVIARDGAQHVEVGIRLQKALKALETVGDPEMREAAAHQARLALARSKKSLQLPDDLTQVRAASMFETA